MKLNEIYYPLFSLSLLSYPFKDTIVAYLIIGNLAGLILTFMAWNIDTNEKLQKER